MSERFLGFDIGAERIKIAEVIRVGGSLVPGRVRIREHGKNPRSVLGEMLAEVDVGNASGAAATGRMARALRLAAVPTKAAVAQAVSLLYGGAGAWTVVSIGSHGFAVIDLLADGVCRIRENSRCSQGTGNFLRQLVERFGLTLTQADALCADVSDPLPLSGRCPVILKTDMTHLANAGAPAPRILAGLYDAVCENVQTLVKPNGPGARMVLTGGVTVAPRIRMRFFELASKLGHTLIKCDLERDLFLEAFGAAAAAARHGYSIPDAGDLVAAPEQVSFEALPSLASGLQHVTRMTAKPLASSESARVMMGFDIGSTGAKALALDVISKEPVWHAYTYTLGNPVGAAQLLTERFLAENADRLSVLGCGVTGSGREIVGSLLSSCFGSERVFVLNEIAAHATGALHFDPNVDTVFEIGGQDAKYIRLESGRICDAAMNEACSAGTGSFIEEQGRKFSEIKSIADMSPHALRASHGVSLGQHCSVFMAEIIDQAVAAGETNAAILAGIYDAVVRNYLNRVKGTRSVGNVIFCQGMPFAADALAAAVAQRTGRRVIVPPHPGIVGALGIALLANRELNVSCADSLAMAAFQTAEVEQRDTFVCPSTRGCGGSGNHCRIERLRTRVGNETRRFMWGGSCSLYDNGARRQKSLAASSSAADATEPDRAASAAPDPFTERERLIDELAARIERDTSLDHTPRATVAITDEFALKSTLPFFATFVHALGLATRLYRHADRRDLRRGIDIANVPYCAPMQLYHGIAWRMLKDEPDYLLAPLLRELPRSRNEPNSSTCPIVQAGPGLLRESLLRGNKSRTRLLTPVVDMGPSGFRSDLVRRMCRSLAAGVGLEQRWESAYADAVIAQERFDADCLDIGERALTYAEQHSVTPVVVLGRAYTIHNDILNSNVPAILREQGALAIPVDCYPVAQGAPIFHDVIWHYSQVNLRAASEIRKRDGVYSVFCSNYSCGPDSFNLHFFSYIMENKPFAIIETDGHSGDAGTKTRIEAFLYCVESDRKTSPAQREARAVTNLRALELEAPHVLEIREQDEVLLIPRMGVGAEVAAAVLRGEGFRCEALPIPTRESLELGRRLTSGKECVPFTITLGSALARFAADKNPKERFALLMPTAGGPCRFGAYNLCDKIAFEKAGYKGRVRLVSPADTNYFEGLPPDFQMRLYTGFAAADVLQNALHDVRPVETKAGAAQAIFDHYYDELRALMERLRPVSMMQGLRQIARGMFGIRALVQAAARDFAAVKDITRDIPTVAVVGEIYVRLDPFANDFVIERLEKAGIRARLAPLVEWLEYTSWTRTQRFSDGRDTTGDTRTEAFVNAALQEKISNRLWAAMGAELGWGDRTLTAQSVAAGSRYVDPSLLGEAVLTVGSALHEYSCGDVDGAVSVGPLECMPNKIAESHFMRADADFGIPTLTLSLNGDPLDEQALAAFVYEVKERRIRRRNRGTTLLIRPRTNVAHMAARGLLNAALSLIPPIPLGSPNKDDRAHVITPFASLEPHGKSESTRPDPS